MFRFSHCAAVSRYAAFLAISTAVMFRLQVEFRSTTPVTELVPYSTKVLLQADARIASI